MSIEWRPLDRVLDRPSGWCQALNHLDKEVLSFARRVRRVVSVPSPLWKEFERSAVQW